MWSQPEIILWWDGVLLDDREEWNEDWAIVDGAGYHDIQELENGNLAFVESNKLTVRYHEISVDIINALKSQIDPSTSVSLNLLEGPVFTWSKESLITNHRAPVLPDLRSGGGFSLICWINFDNLSLSNDGNDVTLLVDGMSCVSGSLDEKDVDDITKGFVVKVENRTIKLYITDGFKTQFEFKVEDYNDEIQGIGEFYEIRGISMVAFVLDGGPKVAFCVINQKIYNVAPAGWKFLPREFGEIGGSNLKINREIMEHFFVFDRALMTYECIELFKQQNIPE